MENRRSRMRSQEKEKKVRKYICAVYKTEISKTMINIDNFIEKQND